MAVITQSGGRQFVVSTDTLFGWKRLKEAYKDVEISAQREDGSLECRSALGSWLVSGRRRESI